MFSGPIFEIELSGLPFHLDRTWPSMKNLALEIGDLRTKT
jgi:hypothetical protein